MGPPASQTELILVQLGTPAAPTPRAVRAFLGEFLSDPRVVELPRWLWLPLLHGIVLRRRSGRVAALYESIWTEAGSPLAVDTERILDAARDGLGPECSASLAYRYGSPGLAEVLAQAAGRADESVVVPLFPQRTASSAGSVEAAARDSARLEGLAGRLRVAHLEPDDADYVTSLADRLAEAVTAQAGEDPEHLVCSFHSIPSSVDRREGGRYRAACERTARALAERSGWPSERWTLCFQSRFGPGSWLGPPTEPTLVELGRRGVRRVVVSAPGFLADGLETLEELGVRGRAAFLAAGGTDFALARAPAGHPALGRALARLAHPAAGGR